MRLRKKVSFKKKPNADIGDEPMKRAFRISILMIGLVGTFIAAAVQQVPAADGGPLFLCPPKSPPCPPPLDHPRAPEPERSIKYPVVTVTWANESIFGAEEPYLTRQPH